MLVWFFISWLHAAPCPVAETAVWSHYADEWGHSELPKPTLTRQDIRIGTMAGQWIMWPKTCTKVSCDVSFLLKLKNGCWKPLLSVQGKVHPLKRGDWQKFVSVSPRSSIDAKKTRQTLWVFDLKGLQYSQQAPAAE